MASAPGDPEVHFIRFTGSPRMLSLLAEALEDEGATAEYEPPFEERSAGTMVAEAVVSILSAGTYDLIKAGIRKFRDRGGRGDVTLDGKPDD